MQTAITTATCIADYLSWSGFSNAEKLELGKLYVPYLALCRCLNHSSDAHTVLAQLTVDSGVYGCRYVRPTQCDAEQQSPGCLEEEVSVELS